MADYNKTLDRAAKLCSTSEKSSQDMRTKMIAWGLDELEADKALAYLVEHQFIDDSRFAHYFVKDKLKFNKWGRIRIGYALRQKGLTDAVIEQALGKIDEADYTEILDHLIAQKISSAGDPSIPANKAKVLRFAAQRGFSAEEIYRAFDRLKEN
ncbi:MAG: regulatory protein RecX [Bacteroidales bacterium]|nr:regulatory protein RecX [Bacteroidales bacterium]MDT8430222.1 regulatory protein RecX [Bacteroidales bacterium]